MRNGATQAGEAPTIARDALRIVILGLPGAGKSSLLGALAQSARSQEHILKGRLNDLSQGLSALRQRQGQSLPRVSDKPVPYPIAFETIGPANGERGRRVEAWFIDTSGETAANVLRGQQPLHDAGEDQTLGGAILSAEALVLAVDASASAGQLEREFNDFSRFLQVLKEARGGRSDVAGLPVFLVLTKCDLIAQPGDSQADWLERIEERKRSVDQRFRDFISRQRGHSSVPFGSIDLHLWATAIRHPAVSGGKAAEGEPYGVAELFRQCLRSAATFRRRQSHAGRRLWWTSLATLGVLGVMGGLSAALLGNRTEPLPNALINRVAMVRSQDGAGPAAMYRGPLAPRIAALQEIRDDAEFRQLPAEDQRFVEERLEALRSYQGYQHKLLQIHIGEVRGDADLNQLQTRLTSGDLAIPEPYAADWKQTEAVALHDRLLKEIENMRLAVAEVDDWYHQQIQQGEDLRSFAREKPSDAPSWNQWQTKVRSYLAKPFPHGEADLLPGSTTLTYGMVLRFPQLAEERLDWQAVRQRLEGLRDLVSALGLAGQLASGERQPLDIPDHFSAALARGVVNRLDARYPQLRKDLETMDIPEAIVGEIHRAARLSYDHLMDAGREVVLTHLQQLRHGGAETVELWRSLLPWLAAPDDLRDWRMLAMTLGMLLEHDPGDPIAALADFIKQTSFSIEIQRITLEVPYDRKLRPAGPLVIYHGDGKGQPQPAFVLKTSDEEGRRDPQSRTTTYYFSRNVGSVLNYGPGDTLYATLPVKRQGMPGDWVLNWNESRSEVYQFERLVRPPRLTSKDQGSGGGETLEDIAVTVSPTTGVPRVPDLVPTVTLRKS